MTSSNSLVNGMTVVAAVVFFVHPFHDDHVGDARDPAAPIALLRLRRAERLVALQDRLRRPGRARLRGLCRCYRGETASRGRSLPARHVFEGEREDFRADRRIGRLRFEQREHRVAAGNASMNISSEPAGAEPVPVQPSVNANMAATSILPSQSHRSRASTRPRYRRSPASAWPSRGECGSLRWSGRRPRLGRAGRA